MSLKAKLATTIAALCMVICLLTVGVFAASKVSVGVTGNVSFVAKDINATVYGDIKGADETKGQNVDFADNEIYEFDGSEEEPAEGKYTQPEDALWEIGALDFAAKDSTIVISLKVVNNNKDRAIKVDGFTAKLGTGETAVTLGETDLKDSKTETLTGSNIVAWVSANPKEDIAKNGGEAVFSISLKIANTNYKVTTVAFSAELLLSDVPETPAN